MSTVDNRARSDTPLVRAGVDERSGHPESLGCTVIVQRCLAPRTGATRETRDSGYTRATLRQADGVPRLATGSSRSASAPARSRRRGTDRGQPRCPTRPRGGPAASWPHVLRFATRPSLSPWSPSVNVPAPVEAPRTAGWRRFQGLWPWEGGLGSLRVKGVGAQSRPERREAPNGKGASS